MSNFKDKIRAAGGKVEFFYNPANGGVASQISGFGFIALYQVAVRMDGRTPLSFVSATGIGAEQSRATTKRMVRSAVLTTPGKLLSTAYFGFDGEKESL